MATDGPSPGFPLLVGVNRYVSLPSKRFEYGLLVLSLGLCAAASVFRIGESEPHADIYQVRSLFRVTWGELLRDFLTPDGLFGGYHPPLYFVIAKAYGSIIGTSLVSLRLLSVIALLVLVWISWCSYPLLSGSSDWRLRLWFSLAVGLSPAHIWWAQTAKYTMWLYLFYALSMVAGIGILQSQSRRTVVLFSLSAAALVSAHYLGIFLVAGHYIVLGAAAALLRDRGLFRGLVLSAALMAGLLAPILPTFYEAVRLREADGLHVEYDEPFSVPNVLRGVLKQWNFGYSLSPEGGGLEGVRDLLGGLRRLDAARVASGWRKAAGPLCAGGLLGLCLLQAGRLVLHAEPSLRRRALYVAAVPALAMALSLIRGLPNRFVYLGFGTWCTSAFLAIAWSARKRLGGTLWLATGVLALYGVSLVSYYRDLDLKYPGIRLVTTYLDANKSEFDLALIDDWITIRRGTALPATLGSPTIRTEYFQSYNPFPVRFLENRRVVAFIAGEPAAAESLMVSVRKEHPGFRWTLLRSWISMENSGRSIHAYRVDCTDASGNR